MVPVAAMPAAETIVLKAREATVPSAAELAAMEPTAVEPAKSTTMEPAAVESTAAAVTATPVRSVGEV